MRPRLPPSLLLSQPLSKPQRASSTFFAVEMPSIDRVPGIGPSRAAQLRKEGVETLSDLRKRGARLPKVTRLFLRHPVARKIPLDRAQEILREARRRLRFGGRRRPTRVAGSVARGAAHSEDLDLLVVAPPGALDEVSLAPGGLLEIVATFASGDRRRSMIVRWRGRNYQLDLFRTTPDELPYALFHWTSPREYVIRTRAHAKRQGLVLNDRGLWREGASPLRRARGTRKIRTVRQLAKRLGVRYRAPAARAG